MLNVTVRGQVVLFDPRSRELYGLRQDAAAIWQLLDGSASLGDLATEMAAAADADRNRMLEQLRDVIQPLIEADLVEVADEGVGRER